MLYWINQFLTPLFFWLFFFQVSDENRRLEKLLKVKEGQICESEIKAKDLSLRAEEFEILFNGQLSSVKALQVRLLKFQRFKVLGLKLSEELGG